MRPRMKRPITIAAFVLLPLLGCEDKTDKEAAPAEESQPQATQESQAEAAEADAEESDPGPGKDELPLPEDFEAEVEQAIDESNFEKKLEELKAEIEGDLEDGSEG